ncbi:hypothetical protein H6P81_019726 [Aristolochia fimbriata]|uniref:Uncharacterized protein n=1 Tax=Aristolochia fimbriata TaxID=158543 RepID=A0AAV7DVH5_ARIFI|nr:hypothetical protein H6P81_019726 [Aristolochia fimbriata]
MSNLVTSDVMDRSRQSARVEQGGESTLVELCEGRSQGNLVVEQCDSIEALNAASESVKSLSSNEVVLENPTLKEMLNEIVGTRQSTIHPCVLRPREKSVAERVNAERSEKGMTSSEDEDVPLRISRRRSQFVIDCSQSNILLGDIKSRLRDSTIWKRKQGMTSDDPLIQIDEEDDRRSDEQIETGTGKSASKKKRRLIRKEVEDFSTLHTRITRQRLSEGTVDVIAAQDQNVTLSSTTRGTRSRQRGVHGTTTDTGNGSSSHQTMVPYSEVFVTKDAEKKYAILTKKKFRGELAIATKEFKIVLPLLEKLQLKGTISHFKSYSEEVVLEFYFNLEKPKKDIGNHIYVRGHWYVFYSNIVSEYLHLPIYAKELEEEEDAVMLQELTVVT